MANLSDFVGERDRRGLVPTTRAIELYNGIDRYFETLLRLEKEITASSASTRESLTIAAPHLVCLSFVPRLIGILDISETEVEYYVKAQSYDQIAQSILTGEADVGISRLPLDDRFFEWCTIARCKSTCLVSFTHPRRARTGSRSTT